MKGAEFLLTSAAGEHWRRVGAHHHHGIAVPLFSLHSEKSLGIGEFLDLLGLIDFVKACGMDVIQLLPLNDTGGDSSPYSALSASALNPIHLSLYALPGFSSTASLPATPRINYEAVWALKSHLLHTYVEEHLFEILQSSAFTAFLQANAWVEEYALFKALRRHYHFVPWEHWPPESRHPSPALQQELKLQIEFEIILQFFCAQQLTLVKQYATQNSVLLMGDLPILVSRSSFSTWKRPELFDLNWSVGAPPDLYAKEGQNWEVPLYNWSAHELDGFAWWKQRLNIAKRYYHLYRIDHVLGLFRFWVIKPGNKGSEGHYVPEDVTEWLPLGTKLLQMMLQHCPLLPIGEDIGKVPHEIPRAMNSLGIPNTRFMPWLFPWSEGKDCECASVSFLSTHDSEVLREWWQTHTEAHSCAAYHQWSRHEPLSFDQHLTLLRESHHTGSFFHINPLQEYLGLFPHLSFVDPAMERVNIPGTISPFNWSFRFIPSVEQLQADKLLQKTIRELILPV
ncbi:MAG: 4-alpha-glucanotransferase [Verrucomicrobia bacterium]|nr:4-alpha-glucanotransferase [Verrucomicrobiota bacterium]